MLIGRTIMFIVLTISITKGMDNGVIEEPKVECGIESINVSIRTKRPFQGRLYVDEEYEHPECVHNYSPNLNGGALNNAYDRKGAEFSIRFGQCNMRRTRDLNPRGVSYSFTLVISFHPVFLTGVDKAFNIKCFFMEAVKAVDVALDVRHVNILFFIYYEFSPLTTSLIEREFELPQCSYQLRHGYEGPFLKFANIGEIVTHVWQCAIDKYLLTDISYDEKTLGAFVNTHVFRYSDRIQLFFTCTLQLCFKEDGGCNGITPPACSQNKNNPVEINEKKLNSSLRRPIPPGLLESRNFLRKLNRMPFLKTQNRPGFDNSFGNPFKDSPINWLKNESDINIYALNNTKNTTARKYREAALEDMLTDLSVDLTVLPLSEANNTEYEPRDDDGADDDILKMRAEDMPQIVVNDSNTDISVEELQKKINENQEANDRKKIEEGKIKFRKPEKRILTNDEKTKDDVTEKKRNIDSNTKVINTKLLSFGDEEDE